MGWVKRLVDHEIQIRMGEPDLEFSWQEIKETDPEVQARVETDFVKLGIKMSSPGRISITSAGIWRVTGSSIPSSRWFRSLR
jgi:hypothetical protein